MSQYGDATIDLLQTVYQRGVNRAVALIRHSAREYAPELHDLENPLTGPGRLAAEHLGRRLPKFLTLRAYSSPPQRCMETAELILRGHHTDGGAVTRNRPLEALGVFYVMDQMKMWKGMRASGGLAPYLETWFAGGVSTDTMMAPELAASTLLQVLAQKLDDPGAAAQLDVCVSHDMTVHLLRVQILREPLAQTAVDFLDALVLFEEDGALRLVSHRGTEVLLDLDPYCAAPAAITGGT